LFLGVDVFKIVNFLFVLMVLSWSNIVCVGPEQVMPPDHFDHMLTYLREGALMVAVQNPVCGNIRAALGVDWECEGIREGGRSYCLCHKDVYLQQRLCKIYSGSGELLWECEY